MGTKKEPTERMTVRLPASLHEWLTIRAKRLHRGDLTAALIEVLSRAEDMITEEEAWLAQRRLQELMKQRAALRTGARPSQPTEKSGTE